VSRHLFMLSVCAPTGQARGLCAPFRQPVEVMCAHPVAHWPNPRRDRQGACPSEELRDAGTKGLRDEGKDSGD